MYLDIFLLLYCLLLKNLTVTGLRPGATYRLRWQAPEKQYPDVIVSSKSRQSLVSCSSCSFEITKKLIPFSTLSSGGEDSQSDLDGQDS